MFTSRLSNKVSIKKMFFHRILSYAQPFLITNRKYIILRNFIHSIFLTESQYELCPKLGDIENTYLYIPKLDLGFHSKWVMLNYYFFWGGGVMLNYYQISCGDFSKRNITKLAHYISHTPNLKLYLKSFGMAWRTLH